MHSHDESGESNAYHYNLARGHLGQARIERQKARRQERAGESAAAGTSRARAGELENLAEGEYRAGLRVRPGSPRLLASLEELIARRAARLPRGERGPGAPVVEEALRDRARGPPAPDPSP